MIHDFFFILSFFIFLFFFSNFYFDILFTVEKISSLLLPLSSRSLTRMFTPSIHRTFEVEIETLKWYVLARTFRVTRACTGF